MKFVENTVQCEKCPVLQIFLCSRHSYWLQATVDVSCSKFFQKLFYFLIFAQFLGTQVRNQQASSGNEQHAKAPCSSAWQRFNRSRQVH
jgi:hypothetical protein